MLFLTGTSLAIVDYGLELRFTLHQSQIIFLSLAVYEITFPHYMKVVTTISCGWVGQLRNIIWGAICAKNQSSAIFVNVTLTYIYVNIMYKMYQQDSTMPKSNIKQC